MQVKLIGKTKKGRERVKQWGEIWTVEDRGCLEPKPEELLLASLNPQGSLRWVHPTDDPNFEMVVLP